MLLDMLNLTITLYDLLLITLIYLIVYVAVPGIFYHLYYKEYKLLCKTDQKVRYAKEHYENRESGYWLPLDKLNNITTFGHDLLHLERFSILTWKSGPFQIKKYIRLRKECKRVRIEVYDAFPAHFRRELRGKRLKNLLK